VARADWRGGRGEVDGVGQDDGSERGVGMGLPFQM
jgi:hypothetical protein